MCHKSIGQSAGGLAWFDVNQIDDGFDGLKRFMPCDAMDRSMTMMGCIEHPLSWHQAQFNRALVQVGNRENGLV